MKKIVVSLMLAVACLGMTVSGGEKKAESKEKTIKVGILHSLTGILAISEKSLKDAELLAIEEINKTGGVLGRQIEPIIEDPASDFIGKFPDLAKKLLVEDKVVTVFGCWVSVSRKNVLPVFEENNGLLFYPVAYEGNECSKNVIYTGATPNQQIIPAVDWLLSKDGGQRKKMYLLGNDYIFPRTANFIIRKYLKAKGVEPVGEVYIPFGQRDFSKVVQAIRNAKPDVIFNSLFGDDNTNFYDELVKQGLTADKLPVVATNVGENEMRSLDRTKLKGHLAARTYFQTIDTPKNREFVKKFKDKYGKDRITDDSVASAYAQVYLWKRAVEKAGAFEVDKVRASIGNIEFDAPEGKIKVSPKNYHVRKSFFMGKIRDDGQFEIIYKTSPIEPDPFPQVAFPGWSCDWTAGGLKVGPRVTISN